MKTWTKEMLQILKFDLKNVIIFELGYRLFTTPIYLTLMKLLMRFSLKQAGYSYLTGENVVRYLLQPWTMVCGFVAALIGMSLLFVEVTSLITAYQGSAYTRKLSPLHIFMGSFETLRWLPVGLSVRLALVTLAHYVIIYMVFLCRMLTRIKPINFIIQEVGGQPLFLAAAGIILVMIALISFYSMFALHGCMIEQKSFRDSLVRSQALLRRNGVKTVGCLLCCHACLLLAVLLLYVVGVFVAAVCVVLFTKQHLALAVLTETCNRVEGILIYFAGIASVVVHVGVLTAFYYQYNRGILKNNYRNLANPQRNGRTRRVARGVLTAAILFSLAYIFFLVRNGSAFGSDILEETQITAHRGGSMEAPENTMAAVMAAVEERADYAELDVQMTADGVIVLGHDANLKRVAGINRTIRSMTWEELQELEVGSWFSAEFSGEPIPSLAEVLKYSRGKIKLNIEIKNVGKDSMIAETVSEMICDIGMEEQCVITSTSLSYLKRVKAVAPELHTGYIISAAYGDFYSDEAVDFISIRSNFVSEDLVKSAHEQGRAVHAWTVNKRTEMERMRLLGVDNIITDYPILARETIYREKTAESLLGYLQSIFRGS